MRILSGFLTLLGAAVPATLLGIVLLIVSADVFARLFLSTSIHVAHDLAIVALAGVVWFGMVDTARQGELFGIRFFSDRLPTIVRYWVQVLVHVAVIVIAFEIAGSGISQVQGSRFTRFVSLGWPKWIVSAGLVGAMGALMLVESQRLWRLLTTHRPTPLE
ncbi:TRAP transporter small permease [Salipiger bermudensis]|uniref:TRAP transporter small permease n=1 Tax=Salipiger bermudensis TaxID=344736 RepID=UPI00300A1828